MLKTGQPKGVLAAPAGGSNSMEYQKQCQRQAAACLLDQQPGAGGSRLYNIDAVCLEKPLGIGDGCCRRVRVYKAEKIIGHPYQYCWRA
ncbi:MAG: hypothetical protein FRX49_03949 [Trebouxia sp. A1-2]|nr:MAG: hypothetical protein FRX49_03949 [Trebouxia sp. A1-2]